MNEYHVYALRCCLDSPVYSDLVEAASTDDAILKFETQLENEGRSLDGLVVCADLVDEDED